MRFLVITDLHQKKSMVSRINQSYKDNECDALLFLGDATDLGTAEDAVEVMSMLEGDVYAIPGNCDPRDTPKRISSVVKDVHGKRFSVGGVGFAALGGSNITIFNTPFEYEEEEITGLLEPISFEGMVLMTHAPSYGILDEIPSGINVGSRAIRGIVEKYHPVAAVSGHIHEAIGIVNKNGTLFMNPGPAREGRAGILDIDPEGASAKLVRL
ncbi:MAG: metallophosphoesterase family protein [Candidatus Methanomethylophilaceae archaeon]|nr:metallophosphoesterase family protein [Candidatus Methanomethylophilaceae archaeon]